MTCRVVKLSPRPEPVVHYEQTAIGVAKLKFAIVWQQNVDAFLLLKKQLHFIVKNKTTFKEETQFR